MKATYKSHQDCRACLDLGFVNEVGSEKCAECYKYHIHTVEVLKLGVGFFGDKAVVRDVKTGRMDTVSVKALRIVEDAKV